MCVCMCARTGEGRRGVENDEKYSRKKRRHYGQNGFFTHLLSTISSIVKIIDNEIITYES